MKSFLRPFPWHRYSRKMASKIENPKCVGHFTASDAHARGMHFAEGREGFVADGNMVHLYFLVDPSDGIIVDAAFQAFGESALIAASVAACELLISKNYDQAKRLNAELIDHHLRDLPNEKAFPEETEAHIEMVISAIKMACDGCLHIPLGSTYVTPIMHSRQENEEGVPHFFSLDHAQKLAIIEQVFNEEVRPYIELDEGGITLKELINEKEIVISYEGNCTSCASSIGSTLSSIQQIIQIKIHPSLTVIPDMKDLQIIDN